MSAEVFAESWTFTVLSVGVSPFALVFSESSVGVSPFALVFSFRSRILRSHRVTHAHGLVIH